MGRAWITLCLPVNKVLQENCIKKEQLIFSRDKEIDLDPVWDPILLKGCQMGRSDKVSLWYVALLSNTRFRFCILE